MTRRWPLRTAHCPLPTAGAVLLFLLVVFVAEPQAQTPAAANYSGATVVSSAESIAGSVDLLVGRSAVLNVTTPITRVSLTTPDIADALVTSSQQLLIHGKAPGTITMFVWDRSGAIRTFEVVVRRDLSELAEQYRRLFPGEPISVASNGRDVVISGNVTSKYVVERAADVAAGYVENKDHVVNLLKQQEGVATSQIMLRVRFAEVSRSALQELGASFFTGLGGYRDYIARTSTQQFPAPDFDADRGLVFSDFLNLLVFNTKEQLGAVVKALQTRGLFQSLAEPNLIAQNGAEASFLAGGEFPYPVVQGAGVGTSTAITIEFKEFGVRLSFTPTVLGNDLVHLRVRPEVSSLDFSNAVTVQGFRIPAISTRRTETEVELRDGQTFAIAGLMNNTVTSSMAKIPGIGDIPIIGALFRSRAHQKNQTELVVMITPHILRPDSPGVAPVLPNIVEPFLPPPARSLPPPPPAASRPGAGTDAASARPRRSAEPAGAPAARPRAGTMSLPAAGQMVSPPPPPGAEPGPEGGTDVPGAAAARPAPPAPPPLTREQERAIQRQRQAEAKQRQEEEKRARQQAARDAREAAKQAERDRKQAEKQRKEDEKQAREQAKRDAQAARAAEEAAKRQAEQEQRQQRTLTEAEQRLRAAQQAYEAELQRANKNRKGSNASQKPPPPPES